MGDNVIRIRGRCAIQVCAITSTKGRQVVKPSRPFCWLTLRNGCAMLVKSKPTRPLKGGIMISQLMNEDDCRTHMIPEYMIGEVLDYVNFGNLYEPGDFFGLIVTGARFVDVVGIADENNKRALLEWAYLIHNKLPSSCHGSKEKVEKWVSVGGLTGIIAAENG